MNSNISTDTTTETPEFRGEATYCPEDNKLRLYVGRVPREEYLKLRAEGWTALHKQRETGGGDFAATWTPQRRDTALDYAGFIGDEDKGPAERAADRAERFSGYRDKRTNEACGHADKYEAGPAAHGFQSQARAERAAARHDRIADRAGDAWGKAEYWTQRTAGVIANALYKSTPSVRMGRIKILEADLRRYEQSPEHYPNWIEHTKLRLAYENQMCEAAGGRAALVEMIAGGFIGGHQIVKVNKSAVTGQVVSVSIIMPHKQYRFGESVQATEPVLFNIERLKADAYRPPTDEELAAFLAAQKAAKAAAPKVIKPPLINPTDADAERLQAIWNTQDREPSEVVRMTQEQYAARSGGNSMCETVVVSEFGTPARGRINYNASRSEVFKVRRMFGGGFNKAYRVVILTDKPQKPLPWNVLEAERAKQPTAESMRPRLGEIMAEMRKDWLDKTRNRALFEDAAYIGWISMQSMTQISWTDEGMQEYQKFEAAELVTA
jgi:primosomal replication protein N